MSSIFPETQPMPSTVETGAKGPLAHLSLRLIDIEGDPTMIDPKHIADVSICKHPKAPSGWAAHVTLVSGSEYAYDLDYFETSLGEPMPRGAEDPEFFQ